MAIHSFRCPSYEIGVLICIEFFIVDLNSTSCIKQRNSHGMMELGFGDAHFNAI